MFNRLTRSLSLYKFHSALIAGLSLVCLSTFVSAAGTPYVSAQLGTGTVSIGGYDFDGAASYSSKTEGMSYSIAAGYLFKLTPAFSIGPELGYAVSPETTTSLSEDGVSVTAGSLKTTLSSVNFVANAIYQFNDQWYAMSKLGMAYVTSKTSATFSVPDVNETLPTFSLGGGFRFDHNMSIDISFNKIFGVSDSLKKGIESGGATKKLPSVTTYMLGFNYAF